MNQLVAAVNAKSLIFKTNTVERAKAFLKKEDSKNSYVDESWLMYAGIVVGVVFLGIVIGFGVKYFNNIGNFAIDGASGTVDESGLGNWKSKATGFVEK